MISCAKEERQVNYKDVTFEHSITEGSASFSYFSVGLDKAVLLNASRQGKTLTAVSGDVITYTIKSGKGLLKVICEGAVIFEYDLRNVENEIISTFEIP